MAPRSRPHLARSAVAMTALLAGCGEPDPAPELTVLAYAHANPDNPFSAFVNVQTDRDVIATIEYGEDGRWDHRTPHFALEAEMPLNRLLLGLHADSVTELRLVAHNGVHRWTVPLDSHTTDPLPDDWLGCEASVTDDLDSYPVEQVVCTNGPPSAEGVGMTCFDRRGRPVWSLTHPGESLFLLRGLGDGTLAATSLSSSVVLFFDRASKYQGDLSALDFEGTARWMHRFIDPHALVELREGPWAGALGMLTTTDEDLDGDESISASGIVVYDRDSDEVLWDWSLLGEDDGVLSELQQFLLDVCSADRDCLHANDLVHGVDQAGRQYFLLNLNGTNQILRVDVDSDEVSWRLGPGGDFELVDDLAATSPQSLDDVAWAYGAHGLELQGREGARSRILLFDNGNERGEDVEDYSRVLELEIDEETLRAAPVFAYGSTDPEASDHLFSGMMGDADMLPDSESLMFIKGDRDIFIAEISYPEGQERWRLSCPEWTRTFGLSFFPSLYDTTWWYEVER